MSPEARNPNTDLPAEGGVPQEIGALRMVLGRVPAFVWKFCPAHGRLLFASEYVSELSGLDREALLREPDLWNRRIGRDEPSNQALATIEASLREGLAFEVVYRFETVHRGPRWFQASGRPAVEDGELFFYGCTTDVTEQRQAEAERGQLITALEQADEAFIITDSQGIIRYVNGAFERMSGYKREEALGNRPSMLKSGHQDDAYYRDIWLKILAGETWRGRFINRRKDGSLFEQWATITPLRDTEGSVAGFVAVQLDMTHQLDLERRLARAERLASVGEAISGAAHTIKNIMNTVKGSAFLMEKAMDGEGYERLRTIWGVYQRSTLRLEDLTHRMLDYVRAIQPTQDLQDLNELGREVIEACRAAAEAAGINLVLQADEELPRVPCDKVVLHDAVLNLIVNAIDACAGWGRGRVRLETAWRPAEGMIEIAVEDNGPGIPPELKEKLFHPFFTTKGHQGNGLGLAMVQKTVQAHRGTIEVASAPGRTRFTIRLPL